MKGETRALPVGVEGEPAMARRTFKYRLYPNRRQREKLQATLEVCRIAGALLLGLSLIAMATTLPVAVAQKIQLSVEVSRAGPKIDRNIFGQFAEHLGHGVYEGLWVGPDSTIPNTRGIRNDVVAALKALNVPNLLALTLEPKSVTVISTEIDNR